MKTLLTILTVSTQKIQTPYSEESNFDFTDSLTISAWVKLDNNNTYHAAIISKEEYGGYGLCVNLYGSKKLYFSIHSGGEYNFVESLTIPELNRWYFVAGTYKNNETGEGEMKFYVDGVLQGTKIIYEYGKITNTDVPVTIGANPQVETPDNKFLSGSIDDVRISGCVLSEEEINELYGQTQCLTADYPFSGNVNDISGNNHHATTYGANLTTDKDGNPNSAYYFDGIDDYIDLNSALIPTDGGDWAISLSFQADIEMNDNLRNIFAQYDLYDGRFHIFVKNDVLKLFSSSYSNGISLAQITSQWNNLAVVCSDGLATVYLNCQKVAEDIIIAPVYNTNTLLGNEGSDYSNRFFKGKIDDVKIFNCILTEDEIFANCNTSKNIENIGYNVKLYPNPANNILKIESTKLISEYRIFDITGRLIHDKKLSSEYEEINISNLPASIYLINIYVGETKIVKRFIKR